MYQCFQKTHTVPDAKKRRRTEKVLVEGGLKELLDDDDPRKLEMPVVEYARSAMSMAGPEILLLSALLPFTAWARSTLKIGQKTIRCG